MEIRIRGMDEVRDPEAWKKVMSNKPSGQDEPPCLRQAVLTKGGPDSLMARSVAEINRAAEARGRNLTPGEVALRLPPGSKIRVVERKK